MIPENQGSEKDRGHESPRSNDHSVPSTRFFQFLPRHIANRAFAHFLIRWGRMVIESSSDSSSSFDDSLVEAIFQEFWNERLYRVPTDYIEPVDPNRAPREITSLDPREMDGPNTSEHGPGPFANSPEEVRGRRRPMRPCSYRNKYFIGDPAAYAEFKRVYSIPPNVEVWLLPDSDPKKLPHRPKELIFSLMAVTEGGIRFPLHQFVRRVLRTLSLTSSQLTVNSYRIITSIIELRRQFNLIFGLEELFGVYLVGVNRESDRYYLSCRTGYDTFLIDHLPDSEEWASIYVSVTGNFMFGPGESIDTTTRVQFGTGAPGR